MTKVRSAERCDECEGPNPAWLTDFDTWSKYVPEDNGRGGEGFKWTVLCPYCFAARVGRATGRERDADAAVSAAVAVLKEIQSDVEQRRRRARVRGARRPAAGTPNPPAAHSGPPAAEPPQEQ